MKKRLKFTNILTFSLIIIMLMFAINTIRTYDMVPANGEAATPVDPETDEDDNTIDEDDIKKPEDTEDGEFFKVYKSGDHLEAYSDAQTNMRENLGYKSRMNGSLVIAAVGLSFPKQILEIQAQKYSDQNIYEYSGSFGAVDYHQETFFNASSGMVYTRDGSQKGKYGARTAMTNEEIKNTQGIGKGEPLLIFNKSTVKNATMLGIKSNTVSGKKVYFTEYKVVLDNVEAVKDYRKLIKFGAAGYTNGNYPTFSKVEVKFAVNSKGQFVSIGYDFVYHLVHTTGIPATCTYHSFEIYSEMDDYNMSYTYPGWAR